jgi:hypothetical protein
MVKLGLKVLWWQRKSNVKAMIVGNIMMLFMIQFKFVFEIGSNASAADNSADAMTKPTPLSPFQGHKKTMMGV